MIDKDPLSYLLPLRDNKTGKYTNYYKSDKDFWNSADNVKKLLDFGYDLSGYGSILSPQDTKKLLDYHEAKATNFGNNKIQQDNLLALEETRTDPAKDSYIEQVLNKDKEKLASLGIPATSSFKDLPTTTKGAMKSKKQSAFKEPKAWDKFVDVENPLVAHFIDKEGKLSKDEIINQNSQTIFGENSKFAKEAKEKASNFLEFSLIDLEHNKGNMSPEEYKAQRDKLITKAHKQALTFDSAYKRQEELLKKSDTKLYMDQYDKDTEELSNSSAMQIPGMSRTVALEGLGRKFYRDLVKSTTKGDAGQGLKAPGKAYDAPESKAIRDEYQKAQEQIWAINIESFKPQEAALERLKAKYENTAKEKHRRLTGNTGGLVGIGAAMQKSVTQSAETKAADPERHIKENIYDSVKKTQRELKRYKEDPTFDMKFDNFIEDVTMINAIQQFQTGSIINDISKKIEKKEALTGVEKDFMLARGIETMRNQQGLDYQQGLLSSIASGTLYSVEFVAWLGAEKALFTKGLNALSKGSLAYIKAQKDWAKLGTTVATNVIHSAMSPLTLKAAIDATQEEVYLEQDEQGNNKYYTQTAKYEIEKLKIETRNTELELKLSAAQQKLEQLKAQEEVRKVALEGQVPDIGFNPEIVALEQQIQKFKEERDNNNSYIANLKPVSDWRAYGGAVLSGAVSRTAEFVIGPAIDKLGSKAILKIASKDMQKQNIAVRGLVGLQKMANKANKTLKKATGIDNYFSGIGVETAEEMFEAVGDLSPLITKGWTAGSEEYLENASELLKPQWYLTTVGVTVSQGMLFATPANLKSVGKFRSHRANMQKTLGGFKEFIADPDMSKDIIQVMGVGENTTQMEYARQTLLNTAMSLESQKKGASSDKMAQLDQQIANMRAKAQVLGDKIMFVTAEYFANEGGLSSIISNLQASFAATDDELQSTTDPERKAKLQDKLAQISRTFLAFKSVEIGVGSNQFARGEIQSNLYRQALNQYETELATLAKNDFESQTQFTQTFEDIINTVFTTNTEGDYVTKDGKVISKDKIHSAEAILEIHKQVRENNLEVDKNVLTREMHNLKLKALQEEAKELETNLTHMTSNRYQEIAEFKEGLLARATGDISKLVAEYKDVEALLSSGDMEHILARIEQSFRKSDIKFTKKEKQKIYLDFFNTVKDLAAQKEAKETIERVGLKLGGLMSKIFDASDLFIEGENGTLDEKAYRARYKQAVENKATFLAESDKLEETYNKDRESIENEVNGLLEYQKEIDNDVANIGKKYLNTSKRKTKADKQRLDDLAKESKNNVKKMEALEKQMQTIEKAYQEKKKVLSDGVKMIDEIINKELQSDVDRYTAQEAKRIQNSELKVINDVIKTLKEAEQAKEPYIYKEKAVTEEQKTEKELQEKFKEDLKFLGLSVKNLIKLHSDKTLEEGKMSEKDFKDILLKAITDKNKPAEGYNESSKVDKYGTRALDPVTEKTLERLVQSSNSADFQEFFNAIYEATNPAQKGGLGGLMAHLTRMWNKYKDTKVDTDIAYNKYLELLKGESKGAAETAIAGLLGQTLGQAPAAAPVTTTPTEVEPTIEPKEEAPSEKPKERVELEEFAKSVGYTLSAKDFDKDHRPIEGSTAWVLERVKLNKELGNVPMTNTPESTSKSKRSMRAKVSNFIIALKGQFSFIDSGTEVNGRQIKYTPSTLRHTDSPLDMDKLLNPKNLVIGKRYKVRIAPQDTWVKYTIDEDNPTNALHPSKSTIPFDAWVNKKLKERGIDLEAFMKTQEFKDHVPILIMDGDTEVSYVAYPNYFDTSTFHEEDMSDKEIDEIVEQEREYARAFRETILTGGTTEVILSNYSESVPIEVLEMSGKKKKWKMSELIKHPKAVTIYEAHRDGVSATTLSELNANISPEAMEISNREIISGANSGKKFILIPTHTNAEGKVVHKAVYLDTSGVQKGDINTLEALARFFASYNYYKHEAAIGSNSNTKGRDILSLNIDPEAKFALQILNDYRVPLMSKEEVAKMETQLGISKIPIPTTSGVLQGLMSKYVYTINGEAFNSDTDSATYKARGTSAHHVVKALFTDKESLRYNMRNESSDTYYDTPYFSITLGEEVTVNKIADDANQFLQDRYELSSMIYNIGTDENPIYTTEVQPVLHFEPADRKEAFESLSDDMKKKMADVLLSPPKKKEEHKPTSKSQTTATTTPTTSTTTTETAPITDVSSRKNLLILAARGGDVSAKEELESMGIHSHAYVQRYVYLTQEEFDKAVETGTIPSGTVVHTNATAPKGKIKLTLKEENQFDDKLEDNKDFSLSLIDDVFARLNKDIKLDSIASAETKMVSGEVHNLSLQGKENAKMTDEELQDFLSKSPLIAYVRINNDKLEEC